MNVSSVIQNVTTHPRRCKRLIITDNNIELPFFVHGEEEAENSPENSIDIYPSRVAAIIPFVRVL